MTKKYTPYQIRRFEEEREALGNLLATNSEISPGEHKILTRLYERLTG